MSHGGCQIVAERVPARQHRLALDPRLEQSKCRRFGNLQRSDCCIADAFSLQRFSTRSKQRADAAEIVKKPLRKRLGVDAWDGQRQQIFEQLMVVKTGRAAIQQPCTQAGAMPLCIELVQTAHTRVHAASSWRPSERRRYSTGQPGKGSGHAASGTVTLWMG